MWEADSEDPDTVNHMIWYEMTAYRVPFPGGKKVRPASDFNHNRELQQSVEKGAEQLQLQAQELQGPERFSSRFCRKKFLSLQGSKWRQRGGRRAR